MSMNPRKQNYLDKRKNWLEKRARYMKWRQRVLEKQRNRSIFYTKVGALHKHGYYQPRRRHIYVHKTTFYKPFVPQKDKIGAHILQSAMKKLPGRKIKGVINSRTKLILKLLAQSTQTKNWLKTDNELSSVKVNIVPGCQKTIGRSYLLSKKKLDTQNTTIFLPEFKRFITTTSKASVREKKRKGLQHKGKEVRIKMVNGTMLPINPKYKGLLRNYKLKPNTFWYKKYQHKVILLKKRKTLRLVNKRKLELVHKVGIKSPKIRFPKLTLEKYKVRTINYLTFKKLKKTVNNKRVYKRNKKTKKQNTSLTKKLRNKKLWNLNRQLRKFNTQPRSRWYKNRFATHNVWWKKRARKMSRRYKKLKKLLGLPKIEKWRVVDLTKLKLKRYRRIKRRQQTFHLRKLTKNFFVNKGKKKDRFKITGDIVRFWNKLTNNSPFYTYGYMLKLGEQKLNTLQQHKNKRDKLRYINLRSYKVNTNKFGAIKFKMNVFKKKHASKLLRLNLDYSILSNLKLEQIWFTLVNHKNRNTLVVAAPTTNTFYYINTKKNNACTIKISNRGKTYFIPNKRLSNKHTTVFLKFTSSKKNYKKAFGSWRINTWFKKYPPEFNEMMQKKLPKSKFIKGEYTFANKIPTNTTSNLVSNWALVQKRTLAKANKLLESKFKRTQQLRRKIKLRHKIVNKAVTWWAEIKREKLAPLAKQKLLNSLILHKGWKIRHEKYAITDTKKWYNMQKLIKGAKEHLAYREKFIEFDEYRAFKWKFYSKRWYFKMSRWKRTASFRWMMRKAQKDYRKISKNFMFIKLFRANFSLFLGITELELLKKWLLIRRGFNNNDTNSVVTRLNQSLQLKMDGIAMLLGLAPNRLIAQELVRCGGIRINGAVITDQQYSLSFNNMLQVDLNIHNNIKPLYRLTHWAAVKARLRFVGFLQASWSIMLFMLVRWPYKYELLEESSFNERWVRFFIRYFPVRISKYKSAKVKWFKY